MSIDLRAAITPDVLDLMHESVFLRAVDSGEVLYWNLAATKLYGWTAEQALGTNAHELLKTRHHEPLSALESKLLADNQWRGKLLRATASGTELSVDARWSLRLDADGKPAAILEISRDVTARTRTALTPDDRERRYRNIFESPAAAFFESDFTDVGALIRELRQSGVIDLRSYLAEHPEVVRRMMRLTRVIEVNDHAIARFSPGHKQDLLGPQDIFWPERSTPVFAESVIAAVTGQSTFVRETTLRTAQGVEFDAEFAVHFDPENTSRGLVTVAVVDITERNLARAAYEHAEFMYRNLFHGMAVPFLRLDSTRVTQMFAHVRSLGVTDLADYIAVHPEFVSAAMQASIVVEANEPAARLFGAASAADMLGPVSRFWIPGKEDAFVESLKAGFAGEPGYQGETKHRRLDGQEIDILLFTIATPEMRAKGIVLAGHLDISEQVAARVALARMQADLAHSARVSMLGELTASIAHEINQPLTAITTNGEAGLRWINRAEPNVEEVRSLMERVVADARRAADVIQRVRAMSMRQGALRSLVAINDLVEEAVLFLRHEMQAHHVSLALDLTRNLPRISADRIQIQQVIVNLVVNAMQAMAENAIDCRHLRIATELAGDVCVRVEDSGPGIPPTVLSHIFERFYSTKRGGMGMGLPICQSIVEAHGGRIDVASDVGVGARFWFTLPVSPSA